MQMFVILITFQNHFKKPVLFPFSLHSFQIERIYAVCYFFIYIRCLFPHKKYTQFSACQFIWVIFKVMKSDNSCPMKEKRLASHSCNVNQSLQEICFFVRCSFSVWSIQAIKTYRSITSLVAESTERKLKLNWHLKRMAKREWERERPREWTVVICDEQNVQLKMNIKQFKQHSWMKIEFII